MAQGTVNTNSWEERETLRQELALARRDFSGATHHLKHALNPKARAREVIRERPLAAALVTLGAGAIAAKLLPALLWKNKSSLAKRFTGELVKGAAGFALPFITSRLTARFMPQQPPLPDPVIYHENDPHLP